MLLFSFFFKYFLCQGYELSGEIALKNNHYYYYYYYYYCPILCSNCGHEDVQWVLETYYVHYDNYGHIDELVSLLIMYHQGLS